MSAERDTERGAGDAVVFPIGHYMGPFHPKRHEPARHHIVRVGWDTPKLPDEAHLDIWALAHGLPARIDSMRWTRQAIVYAAADAGMPDAETILDELARLGLIAEVVPGTGQARDFAEMYRCLPLLIGFGNSPDDPVLDGIGLFGLPPIVKVRPRVFEIWQWAPAWPNLWAACEAMAWIAREDGSDDPGETDPSAVLELVLEALRILVSRTAAYLDLAATPGMSRVAR